MVHSDRSADEPNTAETVDDVKSASGGKTKPSDPAGQLALVPRVSGEVVLKRRPTAADAALDVELQLQHAQNLANATRNFMVSANSVDRLRQHVVAVECRQRTVGN